MSNSFDELTAELVCAVRASAELDRHPREGAPLRSTLESIEEQSGTTPPELARLRAEEEDVSFCARHVREWWCELHLSRGGSGFGVGPITYTELDAWARRTGNQPRGWEVRAIMLMDIAYRSVIAEGIEKDRPARATAASPPHHGRRRA